ncbi:glycoside hydrolase [Aliikangiella coralliicola]|uniref:Glycoside hydrolase n=1 Tax=Aliikangiella coralliicola TaxID=2592383 RepID=A0A545TV61_9GAMM|nr:glycoside hydrolase [Aliikangiella coralliicola]
MAYTGGTEVQHNNKAYKAAWWTQGNDPETHSGPWQEWKFLDDCASDNVAPEISLTAPSDNASYTTGDNVSITANASDSDGTIDKVEFYVDGNLTATDSTQPYSTNWTAVSGDHTIYAIAYDNLQANTSSTRVNVSVSDAPNIPPNVSVSQPGSGTVEGNTITFTATASDDDGTVTKVEFFVDNKSVGVDTTAPYSIEWQAAAGDHQLFARATDNRNDSTDSTSVSFSVTANAAPTVTVDTPAGDIKQGDAVTFTASASDSDGDVSSVEFFVDSQSIGIDTSAPYSASWTATAGQHNLTATATDNHGAKGNSNSVSFTVAGDGGGSQEDCRPDGLYSTPDVNSQYCAIYDLDGREKMGGAKRRVIGYFTSWRTGNNGPAYLANQIPWEQLTHINYAFAHVDQNNRVSVGKDGPNNPATGMEWPNVPGAEMDPSFSYKGHFNLLNKFKKQHTHVKTLISVGGWAETGGYFDDNGDFVKSGGFYTMTTNADNSINHAGIDTFADSAVAFIRQYGFDGVDIDYEYATSMTDAGNPTDFPISNARRAGLNASYVVLMRVLREKLDAAGQADSTHYMLTVAAPSSGYLLRGMEVYESAKYLDYVNIMSYDLHGAWNQFVGPNAALYDNGEDAELLAWNAYGGPYENIGYLNTDWAYHYFRGSLPAGRINIGVPYYTRGWKEVQGGTNGLWGTAELPNQSECPDGTGTGDTNKCGYGAIGIDNLWHDKDANGNEMGAGSNPMWHAKNLEQGISGDYLEAYGLDPANNPDHQLKGTYTRHYNTTMVTPWLWNSEKKVYLSTEDLESINTKADYVIDKGLGGIMFWELAGDFDWDSQNNQYMMGSSMTRAIANKFANAAPYGNKRAEIDMPAEQVDIRVELRNFALGDSNYPITPELVIKNHTGSVIDGGSEFYFDYSTSAPGSMNDQSGAGLTVVVDGSNSAGNNIGGLENNFHRVKFTLPASQTIPDGGEWAIKIRYYLPTSMPSNWVIKTKGFEFAIKQEHPELPPGDLNSGDGCSALGVDPTDYNEYPDWPQTDWQGNPSHAGQGDRMRHNSAVYQANWWTKSTPGSDGSWEFVCSY